MATGEISEIGGVAVKDARMRRATRFHLLRRVAACRDRSSGWKRRDDPLDLRCDLSPKLSQS
jgi:hypothetical protein